MDNRLVTIDSVRNLGDAVPLSVAGGRMDPHITQCGPGRGLRRDEAYLRTKWHLDPSSRGLQQTWAETWGCCAALGGAESPSNTM